MRRAEIAAYDTVEVRDAAVDRVTADDGAFRVVFTDGGAATGLRLLLATGVRDELPPIPGLEAEWGRRVAQCPFCHGHEFAGRAVAVALDGDHAAMIGRMLEPVASTVTIVPPGDIARVVSETDGIRIEKRDGERVTVAGLFIAPTPHQRTPFAEQLGAGCSRAAPSRSTPSARRLYRGLRRRRHGSRRLGGGADGVARGGDRRGADGRRRNRARSDHRSVTAGSGSGAVAS
nr:hypothetical protein GCM10025699_09780 [Microbacterium flavescens]